MYLSKIADGGAYEDTGVVIVGFKFLDKKPIESIVLQIAGPDFVEEFQHPESATLHVEVNDQGHGVYDAASDFVFDRTKGLISFQLKHPDFPDIYDIQIRIPENMPEDEVALVEKMARLASSGAPDL